MSTTAIGFIPYCLQPALQRGFNAPTHGNCSCKLWIGDFVSGSLSIHLLPTQGPFASVTPPLPALLPWLCVVLLPSPDIFIFGLHQNGAAE